ncbi:hypothetical protein Moror_2665 [Moniliophthora roreri MCA 2997]|uniref:Heme haloperoxidase family profile domain-containing protein n=2 Tax=Moniliophthora roreri TaxID=221103 RepID=V2XF20_MONRO|nr:hypothetical protein Moror_2665 [Moniliophthora roreri MCA 2997]KAI3611576.1 hypothetical protein WG66_007778 [Moniliophthora roreri]
MKPALLVASAVAFVSAKSVTPRSPHDEIDWSQHPFQAPGPNDARGPCPGLNTLANHGFLPRDGKNITIPIVLQGAVDGFNVQNDGLAIAAKAALFTSPLNDQFTLNDIKLHSNIEHDGSISRADHALGDNAAFNETYFSVTANSNPGVDYYNGTSAGLVFKGRHADSLANNPNITNTIKEFQIKLREAALYLSVLGDPLTGKAPKNLVNIFFREERLPLEEGWKRPGPITSKSMNPISRDVALSFQWEGPDPNRCPWVVLAPGGSEDPLHDGSII